MQGRRRQLGSSFSTGDLMRLTSLAREPPTGLLSLAASEQMRDSKPERDSVDWASSSRLATEPWTPSSVAFEGSGSWFQTGKAPGYSTKQQPLRKRTVCSQEVWHDPFDLADVSRHNRGVSSSINRENLSLEQVTGKLDSSQSSVRRKALQGERALTQHDPLVIESPRARKQNIDMLTAEFKEEVTAMENQIADIGKSLRMGRFSTDDEDAEARRQEEREEERRRREVELRKARLREKNARDPHRKIQLRLENKRRFEMDTLDKAGIPTTDVVFQGRKGGEQIRLVDVVALRSKCQGLAEGIHSVDKLVELKQRKEYPSRISTPGTLAMSRSMPNLGLVNRGSEESPPLSQGRNQRPFQSMEK